MPRSQIIDVATQSLANPYGLSTLPPEIYETLWWYSGSYISQSGVLSASGNSLVAKGSLGLYAYTTSQTKLHTLSANCPSTTKFAFEATLWNSAANTAYAELWDITANAGVSASQISSTSTTATVVRSGQFTLTPGHVYGVAIWNSGGTPSIYLTDASLIVFPNQQLLAQGSLANITLGTVGQKLTEAQIPLWVYSSGVAATSDTSAPNSFLVKGGTGISSSGSTATKLHTLNANWSPSQKFAFEASILANNAGGTAYAALWDITAGAIVSASQVSVAGSTATLVRSGSFTLTPGHTYAVALWIAAVYQAQLTKAHLVPLFT